MPSTRARPAGGPSSGRPPREPRRSGARAPLAALLLLLQAACCSAEHDPCAEIPGGECTSDGWCGTGDGCWCGLCIPAECKGDIAITGGNGIGLEGYLREMLDRPDGPLRYEHLLEVTRVEFDGRREPEGAWYRLRGAQCLPALEELLVPGNFIDDLSPMARLENLVRLGLARNELFTDEYRESRDWTCEFCDFSSIGEITSLEDLDLSTNWLDHIRPLASLVRIERLDVSHNDIEDIDPLAGLTELEYLDLSWNPIHDLTPLVDNPGIGQGDVVILSPGGIDWVCDEQADNIQALRDRGVELIEACP